MLERCSLAARWSEVFRPLFDLRFSKQLEVKPLHRAAFVEVKPAECELAVDEKLAHSVEWKNVRSIN